MSNISNILGENEVELTDVELAAVQGGRGEGGHDRGGRGNWGGNWGYGPAWGGPAYGYGYAPAPQVVLVPVQSSAPTVLEAQPVPAVLAH